VKAWVHLYGAHSKARSLGSPVWSTDLRKRLIALSEAGYVDGSVAGRFTYKQDGNLLEWSIRTDGSTAPIALHNLADLPSAELSLMALADRQNHLHQFTVMIEGKRSDNSPWALAVHFEDDRVTAKSPDGDRKGTGACGHAAFHCHVGPNLDLTPKVRVPLPALSPVEALDWAISQIVSSADFEPAPWPAVLAALKKAPV
jgi:hypothetical protein